VAAGTETIKTIVTDMCNELAQIGGLSQAERDALVKSFTPKPPKTTKEIVSQMCNSVKSAFGNMSHITNVIHQAGKDAQKIDPQVKVAEISPETIYAMSEALYALNMQESAAINNALLEAVNDTSKDDQAIVTDLINATIEVCTEQTNTLAGHTAEVQAKLEAAGVKVEDAQGLQEAAQQKPKGMAGINLEELEQAAEGLATAVNAASADGKIQSLNQQESQIAQGGQQQQQQSSSGWSR
ncbi:hypothetical protein FY180_04265, partial [Anaplasma marginale]